MGIIYNKCTMFFNIVHCSLALLNVRLPYRTNNCLAFGILAIHAETFNLIDSHTTILEICCDYISTVL